MYKRSCKISQYSLDGEYIRQWESLREINRELGLDYTYILQCCKGKYKKAYGYKWQYSDGLHQRKFNRPVVVLTKNDEFVEEYKSVSEASRSLGISTTQIHYVLKGKYNITHGYKFRYADEQ